MIKPNAEPLRTREDVDEAYRKAVDYIGRVMALLVDARGSDYVNQHGGDFVLPLRGLSKSAKAAYEALGIKDEPAQFTLQDFWRLYVPQDVKDRPEAELKAGKPRN